MKQGLLRRQAVWLGAALALWVAAPAFADLTLVEDGAPTSVIIVDAKASPLTRMAAEDLQYHFERASGAHVPIIKGVKLSDAPKGKVLIVVGPGELARSLGVDVAKLKPEEYVVKATPKYLLLVGHDLVNPMARATTVVKSSTATLWAVAHLLDRRLGVRWLWPGDMGTYVPKTRTIRIPAMEVKTRPALAQRKLRTHVTRIAPDSQKLLSRADMDRLVFEAKQWKHRHMMGRRSQYKFGHAFMNWFKDYHRDHPDYFAKAPKGVKNRFLTSARLRKRIKLCVSNPGVADTILKEWQAEGKPNNWPVCPNDGGGFCTCAKCRALDVPPNQPPMQIWRSRGNLTARYVGFWNGTLRRMKRENPKVTLSSYAYSCYREPSADTKVEDGLILGIVHTYSSRKQWRRWSDAGAKLFLRPNWWHMGGVAPHIPLHAQGDYFKFAQANSMIGFDFDTLNGHWGTQGALYYLIARLSVRP